jgi:hypothetical protein
MARVPDYMKKVVGWDQTATQVGERPELLLDAPRIELEGISQQYKETGTRYAALSATRLELSEEMRQLFRKGETLVDFIRTGVRRHYGVDSDQLIAFGMVPTTRRARPAKRRVEKPVDPAPVPETAK